VFRGTLQTGGLSGADSIRGLTDRSFLTWLVYRTLARGDFHHDFGERTESRDLIMPNDAERFFEIAKLVSAKGKVWLLSQFQKYHKQTLYSLLGPQFDNGLVPSEPAARAADADDVRTDKDEVRLLGMLGIDYERIKAETKASGEKEVTRTFRFPNGLGERSYVIRSSSYRLGERVNGQKTAESQTNRNIAKMFQEVTGGEATKFALIVDATGGLSLSELLNNKLGPPSAPGCEFYIIENIENSSDSADKVKHIKRSGEGTRLFYMKDQTNTVTYPLWNNNASDPKSNIFAKMSIVLNRMTNGTVEAVIDADGTTFHIGDVANASNVKNATLKALSVLIEKGMVPEVFVYTLIKRMGDWCQALSLLDLDRVYNIVQHDGPAPAKPTTTLGDMIGDSVEIGVVTNDRILLAFCILHGLNVFFTSAMDLARLIYFKNTNDLPSPAKVQERLNAIVTETTAKLSEIDTALPDLARTIVGRIGGVGRAVTESPDLPSYIRNLKNFVSNASKLTDITFTESQAAINTARAKAAGGDFPAANQYSSEVAKLKVSIDTAKRIVENLEKGTYAGKTIVDIRTQGLARRLAQGGRNPKSVEVVEARDILLDIRGDVELMIRNNIVSRTDLLALLTPTQPGVIGQVIDGTGALVDSRGKVNHDEILSALAPLRLLVPAEPAPVAAPVAAPVVEAPVDAGIEDPSGDDSQLAFAASQRGGGVSEVFAALRTRTIRILPRGTEEVTSTTNTYTQGGDYVDDDLYAYTVVDEYVVTKKDLSTFKLLTGTEPDSPELAYIRLREQVLMFDMLRRRHERFNDAFAESVTPYSDSAERIIEADIAIPGNPLYDEIIEILGELQKVRSLLGLAPLVGNFTMEERAVAFNECKAAILALFPAPAVEPFTAEAQSNIGIKDAYARSRGGFLRELVFGKIVGMFVPQLSPLQRETLGETLESAIVGGLLDVLNQDDQAATHSELAEDAVVEPIVEIVVAAVKNWMAANGLENANVLEMTRVVARNIKETAGESRRKPVPKSRKIGQFTNTRFNPKDLEGIQGGRKTHRRRLPKLI